MRAGQRARLPELPGVVFASMTEAARARELLLLQRAGEITDLEFHPTYTLGRPPFQLRVTLDSRYRCRDDGRLVVEDVKPGATERALARGGKEPPLSRDFAVRLFWLLNEHPELTPRVVRGRGSYPRITFEDATHLARKRLPVLGGPHPTPERTTRTRAAARSTPRRRTR